MSNSVTRRLFALADKRYGDFYSRLLPNIEREKIIGVRLPELRRLSATLKNEEISEFLLSLPHEYYDENNLHAVLLSKIKSFDVSVKALDVFLPFVDNWSTCDILNPVSFTACDSLRKKTDEWLFDAHEYTVRFAIGTLMRRFLESDGAADSICSVAAVNRSEYYVKMMQAWFFATALTKRYEISIALIGSGVISGEVLKMTVKKCRESRAIPDGRKREIALIAEKFR